MTFLIDLARVGRPLVGYPTKTVSVHGASGEKKYKCSDRNALAIGCWDGVRDNDILHAMDLPSVTSSTDGKFFATYSLLHVDILQ